MRTIYEAHRAILSGLSVTCCLWQRGAGGGRRVMTWGPEKYGDESKLEDLKHDIEKFRDANRPYHDVRWTTSFALSNKWVRRKSDGYTLFISAALPVPLVDFLRDWEVIDEQGVVDYLKLVIGVDAIEQLTPLQASDVLVKAHCQDPIAQVVWDRWAIRNKIGRWHELSETEFLHSHTYKDYSRAMFEKSLANI